MCHNEQIEEIAKIICGKTSGCENCMFNYNTCFEHKDAEEIYNAGYRKVSDIVNEIFEEISKASADWETQCMGSYKQGIKWGYLTTDVSKTLAELKEKFTEGIK